MQIVLILSIVLSISINVIQFILLKKSIKRENRCVDIILETSSDIESTYIKLKEIDDKSIFEKDDEVGFVFTELVSTVENLNNKIDNYVR